MLNRNRRYASRPENWTMQKAMGAKRAKAPVIFVTHRARKIHAFQNAKIQRRNKPQAPKGLKPQIFSRHRAPEKNERNARKSLLVRKRVRKNRRKNTRRHVVTRASKNSTQSQTRGRGTEPRRLRRFLLILNKKGLVKPTSPQHYFRLMLFLRPCK